MGGIAVQERWESTGPTALAARMATYVSDTRYIRAYVAREYGEHRAPPLATIERLRQNHLRRTKPRVSYEHRRMDEADKRRKERAEEAERRAIEEAERNAARLAKQQADAQAALDALEGHKSPSKQIIAAVAFAFALPPWVVASGSRKRRHVLARKTAIRLMRDRQIKTGKLSLVTIGQALGGRDHSTVKHALDTFDEELRREPLVREIYDRLRGAV